MYHHDANKESLPQRAKEFLPKLRKITVIGVESITTTLSLGTCHEPTPEDVSFEETDDKYTVFFSRTSTGNKSIDLHICAQLSRLLNIPMMTLLTCINMSSAAVHELFEFEGIAQLPTDEGDDADGLWLQAMLHPNEPVVPVPVPAPAPVPVPPPVPAPAPAERPTTPMTPLILSPPSPSPSVHDTRQFPPLGTHGPRTPRQRTQTQFPASPNLNGVNGNGRSRHRSAVGVAEHSQFLAPTLGLSPMGNTRDMGRLAVQAQAFINANMGLNSQMVPGNGNPVWPPYGNFGMPPPPPPGSGTGETDLVGVMGEHYVRAVPI